ncbi:MAG: hypothetical protein EU532_01610 [Promethearchaeota archaeon]|nr:MAG: hypothetical protein EU532_01610 [Candidatus Lokiarchaeota archaeon]
MKGKPKYYTANDLEQLAVISNWRGSGNADDPLIIDSFSHFEEIFTIQNSELHIHVQSTQFKKKGYKILQNLENCKYITFQDCAFDSPISLYNCTDITFEYCNIDNIILSKSSHNFFKENVIKKIIIFSSWGNSFINNQLSQDSKHQIEFWNLHRKVLRRILFFILFGVLISFPIFYTVSILIGQNFLFYFIILIFFTLFILYGINISRRTKPNEII